MMNNILITTILVTLAFMTSCGGDKPQPIEWDKTPYTLQYGALPEPSIAQDNALTVQGIKLGRMLFYETAMSKDGSLSCASCHMQKFAFSDTARLSLGVRGLRGKRQAMAVFNMAWHSNEFFWDGRAHLLRDQALKPIQDELEMDENLDNVVAKLSEMTSYKEQFSRTFGSDVISAEKISLALEQFMNSIVSVNSKYDKYLAGEAQLTESEERGRQLFFAEYNKYFPEQSGADCAHCHSGNNFENDLYMNNGLDADGEYADFGREKVTAQTADKGKFKVPSLRNVELTAPYMHDGRFATLEEVIDHYNTGLQASATLDMALEQTRETGLMLSEQDKSDLVAFLKTLTDHTLITNTAYSNPF
ncbi:c-type cytochrome [bacterium]|nr:c-type cytochrome [bacterium]